MYDQVGASATGASRPKAGISRGGHIKEATYIRLTLFLCFHQHSVVNKDIGPSIHKLSDDAIGLPCRWTALFKSRFERCRRRSGTTTHRIVYTRRSLSYLRFQLLNHGYAGYAPSHKTVSLSSRLHAHVKLKALRYRDRHFHGLGDSEDLPHGYDRRRASRRKRRCTCDVRTTWQELNVPFQ